MQRSDLTNTKYPTVYTLQPDGWIHGTVNTVVVLISGPETRGDFLHAMGDADAKTLMETGTVTLDKVAVTV